MPTNRQQESTTTSKLGLWLGRSLLALVCCLSGEIAAAAWIADDAPLPTGADGTFASARLTVEDGASIHYLHGGVAGARPTVVFIPGWTWTADAWREQMRVLAPTRRVVAMDPRSQGESSIAAEGNTPEHRATDLQALLQSLGEDRVVLVGWSQGVQDIAAYLEQFGSEHLAGIVLVDSALSAGPNSFELDPEGTRQLLRRIAIYAKYPDEYIAGMLDASLVRKLAPEEKARQVALRRKTPTSTGITMLLTDVLTNDRRAVAAKITVPTLVIAAAGSGELAAQRQLAAQIAGAKLRVIDNAGHAVFLDQPVEFAQALEDFLGSIVPTTEKAAPIKKR
jgi:non-heme chloroperoxidase